MSDFRRIPEDLRPPEYVLDMVREQHGERAEEAEAEYEAENYRGQIEYIRRGERLEVRNGDPIAEQVAIVQETSVLRVMAGETESDPVPVRGKTEGPGSYRAQLMVATVRAQVSPENADAVRDDDPPEVVVAIGSILPFVEHVATTVALAEQGLVEREDMDEEYSKDIRRVAGEMQRRQNLSGIEPERSRRYVPVRESWESGEHFLRRLLEFFDDFPAARDRHDAVQGTQSRLAEWAILNDET